MLVYLMLFKDYRFPSSQYQNMQQIWMMKTLNKIFLIMWHIIILFWIRILLILLMSFPVIISIFIFYDYCLWSALNQIWACQPYSIQSVNQLFSTS